MAIHLATAEPLDRKSSLLQVLAPFDTRSLRKMSQLKYSELVMMSMTRPGVWTNFGMIVCTWGIDGV
jgi:hypothetical protein